MHSDMKWGSRPKLQPQKFLQGTRKKFTLWEQSSTQQFAQRCCGFVILRNISFLPGLKPWAAWSDSKISPIFTLKWPFWPKLFCESVKMTKNLRQTFATLAVFSCQATGKAEATEIYSQKKKQHKNSFSKYFLSQKEYIFSQFWEQ